jgi:hypothetical protein
MTELLIYLGIGFGIGIPTMFFAWVFGNNSDNAPLLVGIGMIIWSMILTCVVFILHMALIGVGLL